VHDATHHAAGSATRVLQPASENAAFLKTSTWVSTARISIVTMTSSVRCLICDNGLLRRAWRRPERTYPARSFANADGRLMQGEVIKPLTAAWLQRGFKATMKIF